MVIMRELTVRTKRARSVRVIRRFEFWRFISRTIACTLWTKLVVPIENILPDQPGRSPIDEIALATNIGHVLYDLQRHDLLEHVRQLIASTEFQKYPSLLTEGLSSPQVSSIRTLQCDIGPLQRFLGLIERIEVDIRLADYRTNVVRMTLQHVIQDLQRFAVSFGLAQEPMQFVRKEAVVATVRGRRAFRDNANDRIERSPTPESFDPFVEVFW